MEKCLGHGFYIPYAWGMHWGALTCASCICHAPRACKNVGLTCLFLLPCWVKPTLLTQTWRWEKHKKGGLNCVFFFFVSPTDVTVQKQLTISFWSSDQRLNVQRIKRQSKRERRKTQSNYTSSFQKPEVVLSPLHFQGDFTNNVISNYKYSSTQARDFQCSSTQARDFPML